MKQTKLRVLSFPKTGGNPYLNQLSSHLEAQSFQVDEFSFPRAFRRRYDVVHMHWPDTHLWSRSWWRSAGKHARLGLLCAWLRLRGTRIVWTVHNLKTHEKNHWIGAWLFPRWFPRAITDVISLTPTGLERARAIFPALRRKRAAVIPHGHYRDIFPPPADRARSREELGLDPHAFTMLYLGSIRRYKNVPRLAEEFRRLRESGVQLVIAGEPVVGMRAVDVESAAGGDPRVHLFLRHIADEEIPRFYGAADLVVAPFSEVLNSGSVMLGLSMNRPVLAPRVGALPELQAAVGEEWLQLFDAPIDAAILAEARRNLAARPRRSASPDLSAYDWPAIASATARLFHPPEASDRSAPIEGEPVPASTASRS